ncbi:MAG: hypothetical protein KGV56_05030 [Gammaproteobacteria bacterium]|nr:hypothetical protein [Gammaproteobacteria bacterium]
MQAMIEAFVASRKWSKILSVLMIIIFIMTLLRELVNMFALASVGGTTVLGLSFGAFFVQFFINIFFYLIPAFALWGYAKEVKKAEESDYPISHLEDACGKQAKYFKVLGITSLVLIIISLIGIGAALILPMYASYVG